MTEGTTEIAIWVPVIAALGGAIVGIAGSFIPTWWNYRAASREKMEDRKRQRLEDAYNTLVLIRNKYSHFMASLINYVHFQTKIDFGEAESMPPLVKYEMLVSMYLHELDDSWKVLQQSKDNFGSKMTEVIGIDFSRKDEKEKQQCCGEITTLFFRVEDAIKMSMKVISEKVKP